MLRAEDVADVGIGHRARQIGLLQHHLVDLAIQSGRGLRRKPVACGAIDVEAKQLRQLGSPDHPVQRLQVGSEEPVHPPLTKIPGLRDHMREHVRLPRRSQMLTVLHLDEAEFQRPAGRSADVDEVSATRGLPLSRRRVDDRGMIGNLIDWYQNALSDVEPRSLLLPGCRAVGIHQGQRNQLAGPRPAIRKPDR